jgi:hypothetical protein
MKRKLLQPVAQRLEIGTRNAANSRNNLARKCRRETGDDADGAACEPALDQPFRPDEDVQTFDEVGLEPLPGPVGDLEPGEVRRLVAQLPED